MTARQRTMLTVYIPANKGGAELLAQLRDLARSRDRSLNYLVVDVLRQYADRMEKRKRTS